MEKLTCHMPVVRSHPSPSELVRKCQKTALVWVITNMETAVLIFRAEITEKSNTAFSLALSQPVCLQLAPICCVVLPMMISCILLTPLVRLLCGQLTI